MILSYGISFFFFFLFKRILFFLWIASLQLQNIYVSIELCANFRVVPLSSENETILLLKHSLFQECEGSLKHKTELITKLEAKTLSMTETIQKMDEKYV